MANESFLLEFRRNGEFFPATQFIPGEGIILGGESSAWPLGVATRLTPTLPGTKILIENIQRARGWLAEHKFLFQLAPDNGRLRFSGLEPNLFPPGGYEVDVFVGGYSVRDGPFRFQVPANGSAVVPVTLAPDKKRVVLDRPVAEFDALTQAIVTDPNSILDGLPLGGWLSDPNRRAARKACVLNLLAKLRTPIQPGRQPLSAGVRSLFFADVDRIYAELAPGFDARLGGPDSGFGKDATLHPTHKRLIEKIPSMNRPAFQLQSFRQQVDTESMQIVVASDGSADGAQYADIDVDLGNPFVSVVGFVVHLGELLDPGKTDHLALFSRLKGSASNDFLYYKLEG
ncbi:MAG: hypothetical protein HYR60_14465 [Acidobacteria bacterium]|nr:hypothetical protein [Acidobacteriota bacterium]